MEKIWLIIQREYITRVRKKSFILLTLLGPLLMGGLFAGVIYMQTHSDKTISNIQVVDETQYAEYARTLKSSESVKYFADTASFSNAREKFNKVNFYGLLHIYQSAENKDSTVFQLYTEKLVSLGTVSRIEDDIQKIYDEQQLVKNNIDPLLLKSLHKSISISTKTLQGDGKGDSEVSAGAAAAIAFGGGILIYMFIFIYGAQVMRGVMEEKSSRIVEVIMSSVKPFQLMMGKIIGIALVALTQFILWGLLTMLVSTVVTSLMTDKEAMAQQIAQSQNSDGNKTGMANPGMNMQPGGNANQSLQVIEQFKSFNFGKIIGLFIFYFLFGYLLYASMFAAVGAAIDAETDVQQFMLPITIPLIFAYIAAASIISNPDSALGLWCSIIPFTSPIVMMVRVPYDPPMWQMLLSIFLLIITFITFTWIGAKIYRTGILMYGKKVTWKEMYKWLRY
ncbi:MAG TPA: ABC transporter permease [Bacteroidia bacterium]|nr:ABC transporter permease [Bacteroidia bacterium]